MSLPEIFGYLCAFVIGISLGLVGGGGSILAVPVLAYLFSVNEKVATAYSLFIVGTSALVGGIRQHLKGYVNWRTAIVFGIPAIISVAVVRHFVVPALPDILFTVNEFDVTRRMGMFGLFASLMIPAGLSMIKERRNGTNTVAKIGYSYFLIVTEGLVVGAITGLIGAGGGFLIIPALVLLMGVSMKVAVGTSLIIVAFKSLIGFFLGDVMTMEIDWEFLALFTGLSLVGIFIGSYLSNFINDTKLKRYFGYFIFIMAIFIFYIEFFVQ